MIVTNDNAYNAIDVSETHVEWQADIVHMPNLLAFKKLTSLSIKGTGKRLIVGFMDTKIHRIANVTSLSLTNVTIKTDFIKRFKNLKQLYMKDCLFKCTKVLYSVTLTRITIKNTTFITPSKVCPTVTNVSCENVIINNLDFLSYFPGLSNLTLEGKILCNEGFRQASSLEFLNMKRCSMNDTDSFEGLTSLDNLHLGICNIKDTSGFKHLTKLTTLSVYSMKGGINLSHVAECSELTILTLVDCGLDDLSSLRDNKGFSYLNLEKNSITDISPLTNMKKLNTLHLSHNKISTINNIFLPSLEYVYLAHNEIVAINPLCSFPIVKIVDLSNNKLGHDNPLCKIFPSVRTLMIKHNNLRYISKIVEGGDSLCALDMSGNKVKDLSCLPDLEQLAACDCGLTTLPVIPSLENLYLQGNMIKDISNVNEMEWLRVLNLKGNSITNVQALVMDDMFNLNLDHNKITSLAFLEKSTPMLCVSCKHNKITKMPKLNKERMEKLILLSVEGNPIKSYAGYEANKLYQKPHKYIRDMTHDNAYMMVMKSIKASTKRLLKQEPYEGFSYQTIKESNLSDKAKNIIKKLFGERAFDSYRYGRMDVLSRVWKIIVDYKHPDKILSILDNNLVSSPKACDKSMMYNVIISLIGFTDLVCYEMREGDYIRSIITTQRARSKLMAKGYPKPLVDLWMRSV